MKLLYLKLNINMDKNQNCHYFPYEPYSSQRLFMNCIETFLSNKEQKVAVFESPTGTGKSLTLLSSCLFYLDSLKKTELKEEIVKEEQTIKSNNTDIKDESDDDWLITFGKKKTIPQINPSSNILDSFVDLKKKQLDYKKSLLSKSNNEIIIKENNLNKEEDSDQLIKNNINEQINQILQKEKQELANILLNSNNNHQVIFLTRTHTQIKQVIAEFKKIKQTAIKNKKDFTYSCSSLASRKVLCLNTQVNSLQSNTQINEKCKELIKSKEKCKFYADDKLRENLANSILLESLDIEDLCKEGKTRLTCPYFSSKVNIPKASVLLMPYNSIIDPKIRRSLEIGLKNKVIIFDEAHNLIDTILDNYSMEISYYSILTLYIGFQLYYHKYSLRLNESNANTIKKIIEVLLKILLFVKKINNDQNSLTTVSYHSTNKYLNFNEGYDYSLCEFLLDAEIPNIDVYKVNLFIEIGEIGHKIKYITNKYLDNTTTNDLLTLVSPFFNDINELTIDDIPILTSILKKEQELNPINSVTKLFSSFSYLDNDGRMFIIAQKQNKTKFEMKFNLIKFVMLNSKREFENIIKNSHKLVFLGGTLKPYEEFRLLFDFLSPSQYTFYEAPHVISENNILSRVVCNFHESNNPLVFSYNNLNLDYDKYLQGILDYVIFINNILLEDTKTSKSKGILVFLQSYDMLSRLNSYVDKIKMKNLFFESKNDTKGEVFNNYSNSLKILIESKVTISILFAVIGSKLSEGINFNDNLARVVIIVGLPYPNINSLEIKCKKSYYDNLVKNNKTNMTGKEYFENLCFKSVNQSIGRAIRHFKDYSALILLDYRYSSLEKLSKLPKWTNTRVAESSEALSSEIKQFFSLMENN